DYGARGYYPAWGPKFMGIDPLAEKHYSISPYAYCGGNPVNRIDPNGMDWFQNSQTGAVVYVSSLHQGAEKGMEKGWQWMGENDMFKKNKDDIANSDQILTAKNGGKTEIRENNPLTHADDEVITSMSLEGDKATKFMSDRGFDFKPTQQIRYESEINFEQASGTHVTTGEKTYITEKSGYVPKGSIENIYTPLNDGRYNLPATVNRFKIEYTTNLIAKGLNFIQPFIGYHDMRIPTVYSSLSAYPRNNRLINIFLRTNPTTTK
ncbi:MAG TPA: RHS repeat-associated core domain-containing protein, partial [Nostocaceae cyanobacterium]|nr:RHS repeat-associated core domain-containing protein [Nostocaceae cyanobacterium]